MNYFAIFLLFLLSIVSGKPFGVKLTEKQISEQLDSLDNVEVPDFVKSVFDNEGSPNGVVISQEGIECYRNENCEDGFFCDSDFVCRVITEENKEHVSLVEERKNEIVKKRMLLDTSGRAREGSRDITEN